MQQVGGGCACPGVPTIHKYVLVKQPSLTVPRSAPGLPHRTPHTATRPAHAGRALATAAAIKLRRRCTSAHLPGGDWRVSASQMTKGAWPPRKGHSVEVHGSMLEETVAGRLARCGSVWTVDCVLCLAYCVDSMRAEGAREASVARRRMHALLDMPSKQQAARHMLVSPLQTALLLGNF